MENYSRELLLMRAIEAAKVTNGVMAIIEQGTPKFKCKTVELPWLNNKTGVSCIPVGRYNVVKHNSPKFGPCFWVQDVPGRSEILIHTANFVSELRGCIAPGVDLTDMNADGKLDVTSSKNTVERLYSQMPQKFTLTII